MTLEWLGTGIILITAFMTPFIIRSLYEEHFKKNIVDKTALHSFSNGGIK
ncbi:MAG TPA: hypothetical protein VLE02_05195 [Nitrosarchaeum sp.]|nr:hypothetical protein [Nitrosarchaeum sp.]